MCERICGQRKLTPYDAHNDIIYIYIVKMNFVDFEQWQHMAKVNLVDFPPIRQEKCRDPQVRTSSYIYKEHLSLNH